MGIDKEVAWLEERVSELLAQTDKMRSHIEAHEFDRARMEAEALALNCRGANVLANRISDAL